jgi:hypothetical protein
VRASNTALVNAKVWLQTAGLLRRAFPPGSSAVPRAMGPAPVAKPAATGNSLDRLLPAEAIDNS